MDNGVHAITELDGGPLVSILDKYANFNVKFVPHGNYYIRVKGKTRPHIVAFPFTFRKFANASFLSKKDRLMLIKIIGDAITNNIIAPEKNNKSVDEVMSKYNFSKKTMAFVRTVCPFLSGATMKDTSIKRVIEGGGFTPNKKINEKNLKKNTLIEKFNTHFYSIKHFQNLFINRAEARQGYPIGGIQTIVNAILCSFVKKNIDIIKETEVKKILVENNNAYGIETDKGDFFAKKIIYSGFMNKLPELVDEGILEKKYIASLLGLIPCKAYTLWLGMKPYKYFEYVGSEIWFEEKEAFWAMPVSNYDPNMAPNNRMLVGFTAISKDNIKDTRKRLAETIEYIFPDIKNYVEFRHEQIEIPEKTAIRIGTKIPKTKSPVENLYLIGTDTETKSMGLTKAAYSVLNLEKELFDD